MPLGVLEETAAVLDVDMESHDLLYPAYLLQSVVQVLWYVHF